MEPKEQVREAVDVVDLVGEYLTLKQAGQGAFKAVCPFHSEKTPSFHVSRPKQIWHCFGCDKGGDAFAFVMEMEGMSFPEALEMLARRAGVTLPERRAQEEDRGARLRAIHRFAAELYARYLASSSGEAARAYLAKRGIPDELVMAFGLGYAPDIYTALLDAARKKGIGERELEEAGLALPTRRGTRIDRFRHRLMIPLRDVHGATVGFTGRVLRAEDSPKYMNSPQTAIYDKSAMVFGLDLAKSAIKQVKEAIVMEGNLDVVASHKAAVTHVVAVSGTALTEAQLSRIKRYTTRLVFCFDTDAAGFSAARRGMRLARASGFDVRVIPLTTQDGKDVDELVQKSPERWRALAAAHTDQMTYLFERLVAPINRQSVEETTAAGREFLLEISALQDPIERQHWLRRLSEMVDTPVDVLRDTLPKASPGARPSHTPSRAATTSHAPKPSPASKPSPAATHHATLDDLFLASLIRDGALIAHAASRVSPDRLQDATARDLYTRALSLYTDGTLSPTNLFEALRGHIAHQTELATALNRLALMHEYLWPETASPRDNTTEFLEVIDQLEDRFRSAQKRAVLSDLRRAEREQDRARMEKLTREYQTLLAADPASSSS